MTSDYQSGASAMREMAWSLCQNKIRSTKSNGAAKVCLELASEIHGLPLPTDPASSEGADEKLATMAFELRSEIARIQNARDAEITIARCNLLFLEECCRYSLGLAEDLIGDALTKAVGDKVLAMRDETAALRTALEKIEEPVFANMKPLYSDPDNVKTICDALNARIELATEALAALKAPTP